MIMDARLLLPRQYSRPLVKDAQYVLYLVDSNTNRVGQLRTYEYDGQTGHVLFHQLNYTMQC
jgi:hypothetical protein